MCMDNETFFRIQNHGWPFSIELVDSKICLNCSNCNQHQYAEVAPYPDLSGTELLDRSSICSSLKMLGSACNRLKLVFQI